MPLGLSLSASASTLLLCERWQTLSACHGHTHEVSKTTRSPPLPFANPNSQLGSSTPWTQYELPPVGNAPIWSLSASSLLPLLRAHEPVTITRFCYMRPSTHIPAPSPPYTHSPTLRTLFTHTHNLTTAPHPPHTPTHPTSPHTHTPSPLIHTYTLTTPPRTHLHTLTPLNHGLKFYGVSPTRKHNQPTSGGPLHVGRHIILILLTLHHKPLEANTFFI